MGGLKRVRGVVLLGAMVLVISLVAIPVFAQSSIGTILGTVKDSSGGVIAGATVTVLNTETSASRSVTTGDDGAYRFSALAVGHYDVRIEHSGFKPVTQRGVVLDVGAEAVLNFALEVGTSAQVIVVEGEAAQVNTTSGTLGGLVNEEKIAELPLNGRNYLDLTLLQPGITKSVTTVNIGGGTLGTIYSSNGAPIISNNYLLDGAPMQTIFGLNGASAVGTSLGVDGIREYKVVTSAFGAELGMTMGSQMALVSKSGSNQWHGDVFEYLRNAVLDARNYFDTYSQAHPTKRNPQYQRNNFGGAFGGPIRKDKTFFWGVYEGLRQAKGVVTNTTVPKAVCHPPTTPLLVPGPGESFVVKPGTQVTAGLITRGPASDATACDTSSGASYPINSAIAPLLALFPIPNSGLSTFSYTFTQPTSVNYGQIRVDHNFSDKDSLFGRYTIDDSFQTVAGAPPAWAGPQFTETSTSRDQYLTLSETHIFSPALLNTVHLSYSRTLIPTNMNIDSTAFDPSVSFNCPSGAAPCFQSVGQIAIGGISVFGPDNPIPNYHLQNVFTLSEDVFYTRGKHALKFGFLGNRFNARAKESAARRGVLRFASLNAFLTNAGATEVAQDIGSLPDRTFNWYTYGFYAQDDWRVTSRLTLNLGLRYEFNSQPREAHGLDSAIVNIFTDVNAIPSLGPIINNPSKKNFSPRVGFAWDVAGNGKTAIHGAFGLYYDVAAAVGQSMLSQTNSAPPFTTQQTLGGQVFAPGFVTGNPSFKPITPPMHSDPSLFFTNLPGCGVGSAPACTAFPRGTLNMSGPAYPSKQPYLMQWNLTADRQLPWNIALSVGYVGTRGLHLWNNTENNPCVPMAVVNGVPNWVNTQGPPTPPSGPSPNGTAGSCPVSSLQAAYPYTSPPVARVSSGGVVTVQPVGNGRFNQNFSTIAGQNTGSVSWYNGLQVSLTRRLRNGLEFQSAYTYSRALDTTEGIIIVGGSWTSTSFNQNAIDKGPSQFDTAHNWRFNTIYHVRDIKSDNFGAKALKGWWLSNIISVQSGYPFSPSLGTNRSLDGQQGGTSPNNADRASLVTSANIADITTCVGATPAKPTGTGNTPLGWSCNLNAVVYNPATVILGRPVAPAGQASQGGWFNPNMFAQQPLGFLGDTSRNILRGPGLFNWDVSVNKDTRLAFLGEAGMVEFKVDFFNVFNHPNFSIPTYGGGGTSNILSGTPGQIQSTAADSRDIQLALKIVF